MGLRRYKVGAAVAVSEMEVVSPEGVMTNLADMEQRPDEMAEVVKA
jgi:hypothetical protein